MKMIKALTITTMLLSLTLVGCGSDENTDSGMADTDAQIQTQANHSGAEANSGNNLFAVTDVQGNHRQSSEWLGKQPLVINFWGTWCPPCRREIPELVKLYAEFKPQGVELLGVALERSAGPADVSQFAQQNDMNWIVAMGNNEIHETFNIKSVPTLVFYDAAGNEVNRLVGLHDHATLKKAFESII